MSLANFTDVDRSGLKPFGSPYQAPQILDVLGLTGNQLPYVDQANLARYYEFLSANLRSPFEACYPEPKTLREEVAYRCTVLELLDPLKYIGDEFDGIFCKTWKAGFEVNLPLAELELPQDSPNFQLIEDYRYWFWSWRCP